MIQLKKIRLGSTLNHTPSPSNQTAGRAISLIVLPLSKCSRRIRPIVSTVSIPPPPASNQSEQRIRPNGRGSILDADPPAQGVKIARRITRLMGKPQASRIQLRMRHCNRPKSSCASMAVIWRSLYIWMMRYLRRLPFGSTKSGCSSGALLGFPAVQILFYESKTNEKPLPLSPFSFSQGLPFPPTKAGRGRVIIAIPLHKGRLRWPTADPLRPHAR